MFSLISFFFLFFDNSSKCALSAFLFARRSAFSFCAASCRVALISSFMGSFASASALSDSLDSSASEEESESESDDSDNVPCSL